MVDGWELNGEVFPNPDDHPRALKSRFNEYCGKRKIRQTFLSSQNVALIQHRMPLRGSSFSFTVKFLRNPTRKYIFDYKTIFDKDVTLCIFTLQVNSTFFDLLIWLIYSLQYPLEARRDFYLEELWKKIKLQFKCDISGCCSSVGPQCWR